jgi:hypothetical protein
VLKAGSAKARAAGRKAALTRAKNKRAGKGHVAKHAPGKGRSRKGKTPVGFGTFTVNKTKLIAKLQAQKKTSLKPTEVVSLTWDVIRGHAKKKK